MSKWPPSEIDNMQKYIPTTRVKFHPGLPRAMNRASREIVRAAARWRFGNPMGTDALWEWFFPTSDPQTTTRTSAWRLCPIDVRFLWAVAAGQLVSLHLVGNSRNRLAPFGLSVFPSIRLPVLHRFSVKDFSMSCQNQKCIEPDWTTYLTHRQGQPINYMSMALLDLVTKITVATTIYPQQEANTGMGISVFDHDAFDG